MITLSVLVPVYDEEHLVAASLARLGVLAESPHLSAVQVIVVDDCSRDGTWEALQRFENEQVPAAPAKISWLFLRHDANQGKGGAVRTALDRATGEVSVIHDADLEYHPRDLLRLIEVFVEEEADAVFGSRFANAGARRVLMFRHQLGNKFLTFLCNLLTNMNFTDMETCYKAFRTDLVKSIPLVSNDFRIEPELAIKLAKRNARIFEVPISYSGRTYDEGKKINWKDGFAALWAIVRFAASDHVYKEDEHGSQILARLARAPRFNEWMADTIRPFCGDRLLEIGSGVGNLTRKLTPRHRYVASDINPLYLRTLASLRRDRPYLSTTYCDVTDFASFPRSEEGYDTVICLNVIEHVEDDRAALSNIRDVLAPGGCALVLVPQGPWNFGTLDEVLGHRRRYTEKSLGQLARDCGMEVAQVLPFNRVSTPAWFLNGKILRRRSFGLLQVKLLNLLTPLMRGVDKWLPLPPLSLIAVMRRPGEKAAATRRTARVAPQPDRPNPARTLVAWLALLAVCAQGARIMASRVSLIPRVPGGRYATSDVMLAPFGPAPSQTLIASFDTLGEDEDLLYIGTHGDRGYTESVLPVSYLAWPRRVWVMTCVPGADVPGFMITPPRPSEVRRLLFYSRQPPAPLKPGRPIGDRLRLTSSRKAVPWTRYCSS